MLADHRQWLRSIDVAAIHREKEENEARVYSSALPCLDALITIAKQCVREQIRIAHGDYFVDSIFPSLEMLLEQYDEEFQNYFLFCIGARSRLPANTYTHHAAWIVSAQVLGRALALQMPSRELICLYLPINKRPPYAYYQEFRRAFCDELLDDPFRKNLWMDFFEDYSANCYLDYKAELFHPMDKQSEIVDELQRAWAENTNPYAIIEESRSLAPHLANHGHLVAFFRLLYELDKTKWLLAVERLPLGTLFEEALSHCLKEHDEGPLLYLLEIAPQMFSPDGTWTRCCSILVLTNMVLLHLESIHSELTQKIVWNWEPSRAISQEATARITQVHANDAARWLKEAYSIILRRPDGKKIAGFFLKKNLSKLVVDRRLQAPEVWAGIKVAVDVISEALVDNGISVHDLQQEWLTLERNASQESKPIPSVGYAEKSQDDVNGDAARKHRTKAFPFLLSAIKLWQVMRSRGQDTDYSCRNTLWDWFVTLLVSFDPGLSLSLSDKKGQYIAISLMSEILSSYDNPHATWTVAFDSLERQRYRMRYRESTVYWSFSSSEILNTVALHAWSILANMQGHPLTEMLRQWMVDIFENTWFMYLTACQSLSSNRETVRTLIVHAVSIFILDSTKDDDNFLKTIMSRIASDPQLSEGIAKLLACHCAKYVGMAAPVRERIASLGIALSLPAGTG